MKLGFTFQAATHPTKVSLRVYIKYKWNICSGLLLHISLSQKISQCQPWAPRGGKYSYWQRNPRESTQALHAHSGWWSRRLSKEKPWRWWMNSEDLGMDLGQNLRSTRLWISQSFCICVTAWICLFLPFDTFSKPTKLLNSHWRALTEAGMLFPGKKSPTERKHCKQNIHNPGCI